MFWEKYVCASGMLDMLLLLPPPPLLAHHSQILLYLVESNLLGNCRGGWCVEAEK